MSGVTVVFAGEMPEQPLTWVRVGDGGRARESGHAGLEDLRASVRGDVILVLPGTLVTAHTVALPARNERQALAAAPFAIEDEVASEVDGLHVALAPKPRDAVAETVRTVFAIHRETFADWLEAAAGVGLTLDSVLPDFACLPGQADAIRLAHVEGRVILRDGAWGAALDAETAEQLLEPILAARGEDRAVERIDAADALAVLAAGAADAELDLRQGVFASGAQSEDMSWLAPVRNAAIAALAAMALLITANLVDGYSLSAKTDAVRAETEARFKSMFPDVTRVRNVRAQLRERTGGSAGAPDFLLLSAAIAAAIDGYAELDVDALRYDAATGVMSSSVLFSSYDDFAGFRSRIEAAGAEFTEGGSRQAGQRRSGEFTVRMPR